MRFTCEHCGGLIHGVGTVHDGKFIHHKCLTEYDKEKEIIKEYRKKQILDKWIASGLLEGFRNTEVKSTLQPYIKEILNKYYLLNRK